MVVGKLVPILIFGTTSLFHGAPVSKSEVGYNVPKTHLVQSIQSVALTPEAQVQYQPFHYDPMGSHPNSYAPANCTWGAASMKGNIPGNWGNARDWVPHARAAGKIVTAQPLPGAVAVEESGYYGHVAVVIGVGSGSVTVTEMNYDWHGSVRNYTYPVGHFVYIWM